MNSPGQQVVLPADAPAWAVAMITDLNAIIAQLQARIAALEP
jgi:hypothetical protein